MICALYLRLDAIELQTPRFSVKDIVVFPLYHLVMKSHMDWTHKCVDSSQRERKYNGKVMY